MVKVSDLFGGETELPNSGGNKAGRNKSGGYIENPMHPHYGVKSGEKCKNCKYIVKKVYAKVYYKCSLRGNVDTASAKSDHKVDWDACGEFKKRD